MRGFWRTACCPRRIAEYGPLAYGFQCHVEFTPEVVEALIAVLAEEFSAARSRPHRRSVHTALPVDEAARANPGRRRFVQSPDVLRAHDCRAMNQARLGFLDALMAGYDVRRTDPWLSRSLPPFPYPP